MFNQKAISRASGVKQLHQRAIFGLYSLRREEKLFSKSITGGGNETGMCFEGMDFSEIAKYKF